MTWRIAAMNPVMTQRPAETLRRLVARLGAALAAAVMAAALLAGGPTAGSAAAAPPLVAKDFSKPAIVILGYGLKPDGTMRLILHTRVLAGMAVGHMFPQ